MVQCEGRWYIIFNIFFNSSLSSSLPPAVQKKIKSSTFYVNFSPSFFGFILLEKWYLFLEFCGLVGICCYCRMWTTSAVFVCLFLNCCSFMLILGHIAFTCKLLFRFLFCNCVVNFVHPCLLNTPLFPFLLILFP